MREVVEILREYRERETYMPGKIFVTVSVLEKELNNKKTKDPLRKNINRLEKAKEVETAFGVFIDSQGKKRYYKMVRLL